MWRLRLFLLALVIVAVDAVFLWFGLGYLRAEGSRLVERNAAAARANVAAAREAVERELAQLVDREEGRSWREYSALHVPEDVIGQGLVLRASPLRDMAPDGGALCYFSLDVEGRFSSPWEDPTNPGNRQFFQDQVGDNNLVITGDMNQRLLICESLVPELQVRAVENVPPAGLLRDLVAQEALGLNFQPANTADEIQAAQGGDAKAAEKLSQAWNSQQVANSAYRSFQRLTTPQQRQSGGYGEPPQGHGDAALIPAGVQVRVGDFASVTIPAEGEPFGKAVFYLRSIEARPWDASLGNAPRFQGFQVDVDRLLGLARGEGIELDDASVGAGAASQGRATLPPLLDHVAVTSTLEPADSSALLVPRALLYSSASLLFLLGTAGVLALGSLLTRRDELLRRRMDFVAAVSHELKAPLSGIRALAELMDTGIVRDETKQREYVSHILHESERLSRIVANVLDLAKLERKTRTYAAQTIEPTSVVQSVIASFREHMAREGVTLKAELPDRLPSVVCDADALSQVISTLLDNACKYAGRMAVFEGRAPEGRVPEVRLVGQAVPGAVWIEVRDNGPGIPAAEREKVFTSFYRGEQHLEGAVGGAGLGLSIARRHMEAMGGELSVIDSDRGACFRAVLPATQRA